PDQPGHRSSASGTCGRESDKSLQRGTKRGAAAHPSSIAAPPAVPGFRLQPGWLRQPRAASLPLLPSGPDGVRRPGLRRSQPSTLPPPALAYGPDLGREFDPAMADCRCREPPAPRLARPQKVYRPSSAWRFAQKRFPNVASAATGMMTSDSRKRRPPELEPSPCSRATPPNRTPINVVEAGPRVGC